VGEEGREVGTSSKESRRKEGTTSAREARETYNLVDENNSQQEGCRGVDDRGEEILQGRERRRRNERNKRARSASTLSGSPQKTLLHGEDC